MKTKEEAINKLEYLEKELIEVRNFIQNYPKTIKVSTDLDTFEQCCEIVGENPLDYQYEEYMSFKRRSSRAYDRLCIIIEAANKLDNDSKVWETDWNNSNQPKYKGYFLMSEMGFSFVGSLLCFKTKNSCEYICKTFLNEFKMYMIK